MDILKKESLKNIILNRHSTYNKEFITGKKIDDDVIKEILELAVWAPTHKLTQPWHFVVFANQGVSTFFMKQKEIYLQITLRERVSAIKLENTTTRQRKPRM
ncbi:MAG: hypothetical protein HC896_04920 [Bacteroidales bacterium]|nr:hypothetical protein [Bacteroidales bacterium]